MIITQDKQVKKESPELFRHILSLCVCVWCGVCVVCGGVCVWCVCGVVWCVGCVVGCVWCGVCIYAVYNMFTTLPEMYLYLVKTAL